MCWHIYELLSLNDLNEQSIRLINTENGGWTVIPLKAIIKRSEIDLVISEGNLEMRF